MNSVFLVEDFVYRVDVEGYQPGEDEVKRVGELLGQPTKKLNVVLDRYMQVFRNYIEKKCSSEGDYSVCIYSWKPNVPFRPFPMALSAFGTVVLFERNKPKEVLAYPIPKAMSYAKSPGLSPEEYADKVPKEVSSRIDGWQLTAYYNPLLKKWVFATRYVLHNMYYAKGRLVVEPMDAVANPYVIVGDAIAQRDGLYDMLDKYRGWTFTFVLEGPEPAVTKPPYPIGVDIEKFKLYVLMARDPSGRLYTWSETRNLLDYNSPPLVPPGRLADLYEEVRTKLNVRSYFAYLDTGDPENPVIAELESDYYPEAMNALYLNDARAATVIVCEGLVDKLAEMLDSPRKEVVFEMDRYRRQIEEALVRAAETLGPDETSRIFFEALREAGVRGVNPGEIAKAIKEGNVKRAVKKALALASDGKSLLTKEVVYIYSTIASKITAGKQNTRAT